MTSANVIEVNFARGRRVPGIPEVVRAFIEEYDPPRTFSFLEPVAYSLDDDGAVELLVYRIPSSYGVYWTRFRNKAGEITMTTQRRRARAAFKRCGVKLIDFSEAFPEEDPG